MLICCSCSTWEKIIDRFFFVDGIISVHLIALRKEMHVLYDINSTSLFVSLATTMTSLHIEVHTESP